MYKEIILSCIIHLVILLALGRELKKETFTMDVAGNQVSVNMISMPKGNSTEDQLKKSAREETVKAEEKKEVEKPAENKKEVKKIDEQDKKPEEKPKKIPDKPKQDEKKTVEERPKKEEVSEEPVAEEKTEAAVAVKDQGLKAEEPEETTDEDNEGSETDEKKGYAQGNPDIDDNLVKLTDGSLSVKHQGVKGLSYGFISKPDPGYPSVARRMGFDREITVRVVMQFDGNGELESVKLMDERDRFGFSAEVEKAVANWKLTPIEYRGQLVKMRFYKKFKFEVPR